MFHLFSQTGVTPGVEGNFANQLVALETGHVSVRLEVSPVRGHNQVTGDAVLTDYLQIQVCCHGDRSYVIKVSDH